MARVTRVVKVEPEHPEPAAIDEAARVIRAGGLVAFATETVYGLGADATNADAVARIFEAKGRPATNPVIVHVDSVAMAATCVDDWPRWEVDGLVAHWWPGPLTIVLPRSRLIPDLVTAGHDTVGIRVPASAVARELIRRSGRPIAAPSANRSTGVSPTRAAHVLKDLDGKIDLILDSGPTAIGLESTVVDMTHYYPRVLRPGPISTRDLIAFTGVSIWPGRPDPSEEAEDVLPFPPSPGRMAVHYAPRVPAFWVEPELYAGFNWYEGGALICVGVHDLPDPPEGTTRLDLATPEDAARRLYASLHDFEETGVSFLVIVPPPDRPEWEAIRDRLARATRSLLLGGRSLDGP